MRALDSAQEGRWWWLEEGGGGLLGDPSGSEVTCVLSATYDDVLRRGGSAVGVDEVCIN